MANIEGDAQAAHAETATAAKRADPGAFENADLLRGQVRVLELIAQGAPLRKILDTLLRVIEPQCAGMLCSILLLDPDGVHVRHGAAPSLPESFMKAVDGSPIGPRAGSCGTAAFRRLPVIVEDIQTDPLWEDYRGLALQHGLRACWSTPIFDINKRVLGTFALYFRAPGTPEKLHWQLIEVATHSAAIAISKQRETEALRASEERFRLAVTGSKVGIWQWSATTGSLMVSDPVYEIFGWPAGIDLTFEILLNAVHATDRRRTETAIRQSLGQRSDFDVECRVVAPDGSHRWIEAKGHAEFGADGAAKQMTGIALDITERKRSEEETRRRESQLAEAQRIARLGSYEWNVHDNTVHRSEELCRIFGVTPSEFKPTFEGYLERIHPDDRAATRETIERSCREGKPFDFEERIIRPDGAVRILRSRGKWLLDEHNAPVKLIGICQDITERKQALEILEQTVAARTAELRNRNEELKSFAYTVSHDLKAPLRGIAGYAHEMERQHQAGLDERGLFCLKQILTATHNLDRLIEDLLHYSRLDAETPADIDVDVARMVASILEDRKRVISEQKAEVSAALPAQTVRTWERGLAQVLTNLIDNAFKYSRNSKPPRIEIAGQDFADKVRISVADNGVGFDMKYHDRIFGLFNRLVRQEDFEGTGAGLAIARKVTDKLGGSLWAESAPGSGATFFLELPKRTNTNAESE